MKYFSDKRVTFKIVVSDRFFQSVSDDAFEKYISMNLHKAKVSYLSKHPDYDALGDLKYVIRAHPTKEVDGKVFVDLNLWEYYYDLELTKK